MTTIADMNIGVNVDPSGMDAGLREGVSKIKTYFGDALGRLDLGGPSLRNTGTEIGNKIVDNLTRSFQTRMGDAREALFQGVISDAEFKKAGNRAAASFNFGISNAIRELGQGGMLPPSLRDSLVGQYKTAGLQAARAFSDQVRGATSLDAIIGETSSRAAGKINATAHAVTQLSQAAVAGSGSIAGIANALGAATTGMALFATSTKAVVGATVIGAIVSVLAVAIGAFQNFKREAEEARLAWRKTLDDLINAGDIEKMRKMAQDLWVGTPAKAFRDGIASMERELPHLKAIVDKAGFIYDAKTGLRKPGDAGLAADPKDIAKLRETIAALKQARTEMNNLEAAMLDMVNVPKIFDGIKLGAAGTEISVQTLKADLRDFVGEITKATSEATGLAGAFETTLQLHKNTADIALRMSSVYDTLKAKLASLTDPLGAQLDLWTNIQRAINALEKTEYFQILKAMTKLKVSDLGGEITGGANVPRVKDVKQLDAGSLSFFTDLKTRFGRFADELGVKMGEDFGRIGSTIQGVLVAAFGPVAILMKVLEPGLKIVTQLFDQMIGPLLQVVSAIATGLEPVFRLLFPVVRALGIAIAFVAEVSFRIMAAFARAVGNVIATIGAVIKHIPGLGGFGNAIQNAGKSILTYSDGLKHSADEMRNTRLALQGMTFDMYAAADAASKVAEALTNLPQYFVDLLRYRAALAGATPAVASSPSMDMYRQSVSSAGGSSWASQFRIDNITIEGHTKSASELFAEIAAEAQRQSQRRYGTPARAPETLK